MMPLWPHAGKPWLLRFGHVRGYYTMESTGDVHSADGSSGGDRWTDDVRTRGYVFRFHK